MLLLISGKKSIISGFNLFDDHGTVIYQNRYEKFWYNIANYSAPDTISLSVMAPNGIIYVNSGNVYMSGVLNGQVTVVADGASGFGGPGNVYLVGDMINHIDPMIPNGGDGYIVNPDSVDENGNPIDLMGIIARNDLTVATSVESGGRVNNVTIPISISMEEYFVWMVDSAFRI